MAQLPQQPQSAGQPPAGGAQLPQQGLTPQQMQQMQVMSKQAMGLLLEESTAQQIVQQCQQGNPEQVVAGIVSAVMGRLYEAASEAGQQVEMVTLLVTGIQIIGTLAEMLIEAGVLQQERAQQFIGAVSKIAVDQHNATMQQQGGPQ